MGGIGEVLWPPARLHPRRSRLAVPLLLLPALWLALLPARASGARSRSDVTTWRAADGAFAGWKLEGVKQTREGELQLDRPSAGRASERSSGVDSEPESSDGAKNALVGTALSPVTRSPFALRRAVVALEGEAPSGSWIETQVRARVGRRFTGWQGVGVWTAESENDREIGRKTDDEGSGASSYVVRDEKRKARAFQIRLRLVGSDGSTPSVRSVVATVSDGTEEVARSPRECARGRPRSAAPGADVRDSGRARATGEAAARGGSRRGASGESPRGLNKACAGRSGGDDAGRRTRADGEKASRALRRSIERARRRSRASEDDVVSRGAAGIGKRIGGHASSPGRKPRRRARVSEAGSWLVPQPPLSRGLRGSLDSEELVAAATRLLSLGWKQKDVVARVYPPFIVAGRAVASDTWGAPRYGPGPLVRRHEGQDVFCSYGAPVLASEAGVVEFDQGGLGGRVARIHRPDGSYWYYAHLSDWNTRDFSSGSRIGAGDILGYCGDSGNAEGTLPHVHFGWYLPSGEARNPIQFLRAWLDAAKRRARAELSRAPLGRARQIDRLTSLRRFGDEFVPDMSKLPSLEQVLPRAAHVPSADAPSPPAAPLVILFTVLVSLCLLYVRPSALLTGRRSEASVPSSEVIGTAARPRPQAPEARRKARPKARFATLLWRALPAVALAGAVGLLLRGRGTRKTSKRAP